MAKQIKAKADLGVNTIMDPVMIPDGFSRVCDGLDLRSGTARPWKIPTNYRNMTDPTSTCIWEYRGKWYESKLMRSYHGEYLYAQETVFFTEEGADHLPPQKIVDGKSYRLGIMRPLSMPLVSVSDKRYPAVINGTILSAGSVQPTYASYRIAGMVKGSVLVASDALKVVVATASTIRLVWRKVPGCDGYAIFGRTSGSERLLVTLGDVNQWDDDGTAPEGTSTAASYDAPRSYRYVYTYYRKIGAMEDESGPSPVSYASEANGIPVITRTPQYDGSYTFGGGVTFDVPAHTATIYVPSTYYTMLWGSYGMASRSYTTFVSATAHGLASGTIGHITGSPAISRSTPYAITVPPVLASPGITLNGYEAGGTVPTGAHTYKFAAVRGGFDLPATGVSGLALTLTTSVAVTVPGGSQKVRFNINTYTVDTDSILVFRDDVAIAFIPISTTPVATWVDDGTAWWQSLASITVPVTNDTSTRCFTIPLSNSTLEIPALVYSAPGSFQLEKCDVVVSNQTTLNPIAGDTMNFSGFATITQLNGSCSISAYNSITKHITLNKWVPLEYDNTTDATPAAKIMWSGGSTSGVAAFSGWRIYRVGDTAEFLRVADLGMNVESFTDLVSIDDLGNAIPTAYTENGVEVVFDRAPEGLKRMVSHLGMRFGIVDDIVRWTPSQKPDAWPDAYYATFPSRPVALAPFRGMLSVLCEDGLYGLVGNTPSTLSPVGPFSNLGCIAPFSVQASNRGLIWLSKPGIAISLDGVSAQCLSTDRAPGRYFYMPSTSAVFGGLTLGHGWLVDSTQTPQFAESMRYESINQGLFPVTEVTNDLPISGEISDIKSFYWDNRYFLYYPGNGNYARSATICFDMGSQHMPMTTLPVKPTHVHVSMGGDCYMLLNPRFTLPVASSSVVYQDPDNRYFQVSVGVPGASTTAWGPSAPTRYISEIDTPIQAFTIIGFSPDTLSIAVKPDLVTFMQNAGTPLSTMSLPADTVFKLYLNNVTGLVGLPAGEAQKIAHIQEATSVYTSFSDVTYGSTGYIDFTVIITGGSNTIEIPIRYKIVGF